MGYRSNVMYAIAGPIEKMITFITAAKLIDPHYAKAIAELSLLEHGEAQLVLVGQFDDVKWYPDHPDVITHTAFWNYAEEAAEEFELEGSFCRTGEEADDNESKNFGPYGYELVCINREIVTSFDSDAPKRVAP